MPSVKIKETLQVSSDNQWSVLEHMEVPYHLSTLLDSLYVRLPIQALRET